MNNKVYITPEGARQLRDELKHIWKVVRPEITQKVAAAAALGDRSENADYIYGKKQLREIDTRIRYLTGRLDHLEIVDRKPDNQSKVFFAAWIKLEAPNGNIKIVRIVGTDEINPNKGWISLDAPLAKVLLGKTKGESVIIKTPTGRQTYYLLDVSYAGWGNQDEGNAEL